MKIILVIAVFLTFSSLKAESISIEEPLTISNSMKCDPGSYPNLKIVVQKDNSVSLEPECKKEDKLVCLVHKVKNYSDKAKFGNLREVFSKHDFQVSLATDTMSIYSNGKYKIKKKQVNGLIFQDKKQATNEAYKLEQEGYCTSVVIRGLQH